MSERRGDWMITWSGRQFWPLDPRPEEICITDIAHALAMQCRFAGHCLFHYSVAQHSVLVSRNVPPEHALWGLLHDASEAYLTDLSRPVKHHSSLGELYRQAKDRLMACIAEKYKLGPMPGCVKFADDRALMTEKRDLMRKSPHAWSVNVQPFAGVIHPITPDQARGEFMLRFAELVG